MTRLQAIRYCYLHLALAWGEWRARRLAAALERKASLPSGWLLQPGNLALYQSHHATRARWRMALQAQPS